MCRLLGICGQVDNWREVALAFSKQSETGNLPPVDKSGTGHKDGWGMSISNHEQTAMVPLVRQLGSAYGSTSYREALFSLGDQPDILLCHLRKASDIIPITLPNTHPFVHNGWAFIHNGTVYHAETLPRDPALVFSSDDSDTEHLFHYLLTKIKGDTRYKSISAAIVDSLSSLTLDYTALNMMLSNGRRLYVARCFKNFEDYYTLYYYPLPTGIIICSEPIESEDISQDRWVLIANNSFVKIQCDPPHLEVTQIKTGAC